MAGKPLAIYRLPTAGATQVGTISIITDRTGRMHINGIKVVEITHSGEFATLTTAKDASYHVKAQDLAALQARGKR